ncbi:hypothetical protein KJY73_07050 [Bowmanella sp. Y26]|uniref:hypothetical protein n=1 Tax=Bowmanella yangjiangensis TaxID=2811230 RepID=UPI001BDD3C73|nr:hypothetical protein [Bowmanella yangjiangensis]MBT1063325.1 hypothetical protein [Bowmanella yangjiangensis]
MQKFTHPEQDDWQTNFRQSLAKWREFYCTTVTDLCMTAGESHQQNWWEIE